MLRIFILDTDLPFETDLLSIQEGKDIIHSKIGIETIGTEIRIEVDPLVEDEDFPELLFHDFLDLDPVDGQRKEGQCAIDVEELGIPLIHVISM